MTDESKTPIINVIEDHYFFTLDLSDGTQEEIKIPRMTTRMKYKASMEAQKLGASVTGAELSESILNILVPGLMDRFGDKSPTMLSLGQLTAKIFEMDGDAILGKGWRKNLPVPAEGVIPKIPKKRGRKPKKR